MVGDSLGKGFIILGMFLASYYLPFEEFARVTLGYSFVSTVWFFLDFGVNIKGIRRLANNQFRQYSVLASLRTISAVITALLILLFFIIGQTVLALFLIGVFFRVLSLDWVMRSRMRYLHLGFITLLSGLFFLSFVFIAAQTQSLSAEMVGLSYALLFFIFFILSRFILRDFSIYTPRLRAVKANLLSSGYFSLSGLVVASFINAPVFILGILGGYEFEVAQLGVIILFVNSAAFLISIYILALMPIMVKNSNSLTNSTPLIVSGVAAAVSVFFGLVIYGFISDFKFSVIEISLPSFFVILYSLRRLYDSKLLLSKGEANYLFISISVLSVLVSIFYYGIMLQVLTIASLYGLSIVIVEFVFLGMLSYAVKSK